jgi:hypothetical protein
MDRLMRALPRPSQSTLRDALALGGAVAVVAGVAVSFGLGAAAIVAGLLAIALSAAWSLIASLPVEDRK